MPNLDTAREVIKQVNLKFRDGCGNQPTGAFDFDTPSRRAKLDGSQRKALKEGVEHQQVFGIRVVDPDGKVTQVIDTLRPTRAWATGQWLESEPTATVGNCGERSFLAAYLLRKANVPHVTVLTGPSATSINHDFVVIGATDVADRSDYSQDTAPGWSGQDIVICDPWFQGTRWSYECGIAYRLAEWPTWMPKIIDTTLAGYPHEKTLNRKKFSLEIIG
jgi:hypothetical protein